MMSGTKRKNRLEVFSHEEKVSLITQVKNNPVIWNLAHPKHCDVNYVNRAWKEIPKKLTKNDEEIGGHLGMEKFVKTEDFRKLNVGFSLDEGIASSDDTYLMFFAERSIWHVHFIINGTAGHGSLLHENTAGQKLHYVLNKMMEYRQREFLRLEGDSSLSIGDVTTINLTIVKGGVQSNVVPPVIEAVFDVRLANDVHHDTFEKQIQEWCEEAGGGINLIYEQKEPKVPESKLDNSNPFWKGFKSAIDELGLKIRTLVFPGGTDSRYVREIGIPALGFSPMINTPVLLHDHDEFIQADIYLKGIEIYQKIIPALANV